MEATPTRQQDLLESEDQVEPVCTHYWKIERPSGPVSKGECKTCGEVRDFHNYVEGSFWGGGSDKKLLENLSGSSRVPAGVNVTPQENTGQLAEDS